jgi:hypothetical protein
VTARRSDHADPVPKDVRRARVLPQVDRAQRIAAMLSRWEAEDVSEEPDWEVAGIEPLTLRSRPSGS